MRWGHPSTKATFLNSYKVLSLSIQPSKTKETVFKSLNKTMLKQNKAFKSGMATDVKCFIWKETKTMEHILHGYENYSTKIWDLAGQSLTLAMSRHSGDYIPVTDLTPPGNCPQQTSPIYSPPH
jgi:hypothetical protein